MASIARFLPRRCFTDDSHATVTAAGIDTRAKKIEANKTI
jgi:hypothetical protein